MPRDLTPEIVAYRLIQMGYLKYLSGANEQVAAQELVASLRSGYLGTEWDDACVSRDRRSYPADSESLSEGGIGESLVLMRHVLRHEGVPLRSVEDRLEEDRYAVAIDGQLYSVFAESTGDYANWAVATRRLLEIANGLLESCGSAERLYGLYGGNDGRAVLLTDEMYNLIRSSGLIVQRAELPYRPSAINHDGSIED